MRGLLEESFPKREMTRGSMLHTNFAMIYASPWANHPNCGNLFCHYTKNFKKVFILLQKNIIIIKNFCKSIAVPCGDGLCLR
ncbi:hypothetical protein SUBVAR_05260 [Subdoligranulum variabile DSM 15176]|uniref:Uncharacterized protein n=1 Tax=Subdoligranulum variabile DSM 15176 TaxID=411471 RepID=D1PLP3_9FIRM|nr:hypothetical protein SUBVAR_05260 [Subdoligranulum variabile DSM 15176]